MLVAKKTTKTQNTSGKATMAAVTSLLSRSDIALVLLKYVALAITTASGCYATLSDTKDKASGRLTKAGRVVFGCLIASALVAIVSQSLETWQSLARLAASKSADEQKQQRENAAYKAQMDQLGSILSLAQQAGDNSRVASQETIQANSKLANVIEEESSNMEQSWRLLHPFGAWKAASEITGIAIEPKTNERKWAARLVDYAKSHNPCDGKAPVFILVGKGDPLYPKFNTDVFFTEFDKTVGVGIMRDKSAPIPKPGEHADMELGLTPEKVLLAVHLDKRCQSVESIDADTVYSVRSLGSGNSIVSNWVDLYGSRMLVSAWPTLIQSERLQLEIYYSDTVAPPRFSHTWQSQSLTPPEGRLREDLYTAVLGEKDLGSIPGDYVSQFPRQYRLLHSRLASASRTDNKLAAGI